jgi:hypothetical protein
MEHQKRDCLVSADPSHSSTRVWQSQVTSADRSEMPDQIKVLWYRSVALQTRQLFLSVSGFGILSSLHELSHLVCQTLSAILMPMILSGE